MATPRAGYRTKDGNKIPSVTTILGRFKDSGALIKWGYRQGREHEQLETTNRFNLRAREIAYRDTNYAPFTELFGGDENWMVREIIPAPSDLYEVTEKAAAAGTIAHDMIEWHILGKPVMELAAEKYADTPPDIKRRANNSYQQFLKWLAQTRIEITHTEMGLVSEAHRYGGTLDALGRDADGAMLLLDHKTSNGVYADYLYQLAAYALLVEENHPELKPTGFHLLRYAKESADFSHHYWGELDAQKEGFLLMRKLYEIDYQTKQRCR